MICESDERTQEIRRRWFFSLEQQNRQTVEDFPENEKTMNKYKTLKKYKQTMKKSQYYMMFMGNESLSV